MPIDTCDAPNSSLPSSIWSSLTCLALPLAHTAQLLCATTAVIYTPLRQVRWEQMFPEESAIMVPIHNELDDEQLLSSAVPAKDGHLKGGEGIW